MADQALRVLLRRLGCTTAAAGAAALSDAQLLERFVARRDEAAFELLVWRHGTMVLNLCRRLLHHEQDAEDAFQATFLILTRKAGSIGKRHVCASWLYKVAYRVALAARAKAAARSAREAREGGCADNAPAPERTDDVLWCDLRPVLDEEVRRLPEKYRAAFVLCCLEGRTGDEAAEQLRCPKGTVLSRLSRARERLRRRLLLRGISLSVSLLAAAVAAHGQAAEPTTALVTRTAKAALAGATFTSARAAALMEGVLRAMFLSKLTTAVGIMAMVCIVGIVAGFVGDALLADPGQPDPRQPQPSLAPAAPAAAPAAPATAGAAVPPQEGPGPDDPANAALRHLQSRHRLKQIGSALQHYADTYRKLPAPAIYQGYPDGLLPEAPAGNVPAGGGSAGPAASGDSGAGSGAPAIVGTPALGPSAKALLSWRVAILPFLGEGDLYRQFKRDEPWDSEHNRKLLARMPAVYAAPGMKSDQRTYYQAIVGTGAAWEPRHQMHFPASIPDGTSNTILVVEAGTPVPWTKPEDLPYVADQALPRFGGLFGGDFHALFADGVVKFLSARADEQQLRFAIMPADGNNIDLGKLLVHGGKGATGGAAVKDLLRENEQLREAMDALQKTAAKEQEALDVLRAKRVGQAPKTDANEAGARLTAENAKLQRALDRAMEEVEKLRSERRRLEQELQQRLKNQEK